MLIFAGVVAGLIVGVHVLSALLVPLLAAGYQSGAIQPLPDWAFMVPMSIYVLVVALAGAVLCAAVESPTPLKWCLGLGILCAAAVAESVRGFTKLFNMMVLSTYMLAVALTPILSGWCVKRLRRKS